jgi:hypothetical protein
MNPELFDTGEFFNLASPTTQDGDDQLKERLAREAAAKDLKARQTTMPMPAKHCTFHHGGYWCLHGPSRDASCVQCPHAT